MRTIRSDSFDEIYKEALAIIMSNISRPVNSSKGINIEIPNVVIELTNTTSYKIDFKSTFLPNRQERYEKYLDKELDWYFNRRNNELHYKSSPAPKVWKNYADQRGNIVSNYGYMILRETKRFGNKRKKTRRKTSYEFCIDLLLRKPTTKQAILHYNLPIHFNDGAKDLPCTIAAQVLIRENKLYMTVFQRSSDIFTGLPYDVPWHCELLSRMLNDIKGKADKVNTDKNLSNLSLGSLTLFISSLHLYEKNYMESLKINQNRAIKFNSAA
jgi:thymidylate synthase